MIDVLLAAGIAGFGLLVLFLLLLGLLGRVQRFARARDALRRGLAPRAAALRALVPARRRRATRS
jgi:hypothetical protein